MSNRFNFPYKQPYAIQTQFMQALFDCLNDAKIGLFESPTGTGKSLSLICGSLTWLAHFLDTHKQDLDDKMAKLEEDMQKLDVDADKGDAWVQIHHRKKGVQAERDVIKKLMDSIVAKEERTRYLKERQTTGRMFKHKRALNSNLKRKAGDVIDDDETHQEDDGDVNYDSDPEKDADAGKEDEVQTKVKPKIFYCSRTHSQLTQFVNELKRTEFRYSISL